MTSEPSQQGRANSPTKGEGIWRMQIVFKWLKCCPETRVTVQWQLESLAFHAGEFQAVCCRERRRNVQAMSHAGGATA